MKKVFVFALLCLLCLTCFLAACGKVVEISATQPTTATEPEETTSVSAYKSIGKYEKLQGQLTWAGINAFPIKSSTMTIDEARELCVDFFRYSKTALWIADDNYQIYNSAGQPARTVDKDKVYGGLPYVGVASGNVYRTMDYMDESTGVVNVKALGENPELFGNQCSIAAWWGWARVVNSAEYEWTYHAVASRGFVPLGPHYYDPALERFTEKYGTDECCLENGLNTMMESYALLKKGDGIMYMTTAGHIVMISEDAVVVRNEDGTINPTQSYVTVLDQTTEWTRGVNEFGEIYTYEANVDAKWTFMALYTENYLPYTYKEFTGEDPIEDTIITYSHSGETITKDQLFSSQVDCNYGLVDIFASFYDEKGNEVYKVASCANKANMKSLKFVTQPKEKTLFQWGELASLDAGKTYTVVVYAQIGTGERPELWRGTFDFQ